MADLILLDPLPASPVRANGREDYLDIAARWADALGISTVQQNAQHVQANEFVQRAEAAAAAAINAPGTMSASATELTIAVGSQAFKMQAGKAISPGQSIVVAAQADPTIQMSGVLTAYNPANGDATALFLSTSGTGTFSSWYVALTVSAPFATAAELCVGTSGTKVVSPKSVREANAFQAVTFAASIALNVSQGTNFVINVSGNCTMAAPLGVYSGKNGLILFIMGGPFGVAWTKPPFLFPGGPPIMPTTTGSIALVSYVVMPDGKLLCAHLKDFA